MRDNAGDHAVELEDGSDFHDERRQTRGVRAGGARAGAYSSDLDVVRPGDNEREVVLPMERAFEQVGARAVRRSIYEGNACLGDGIIDFDTLENESKVDTSTQHRSHLPRRLPMRSAVLAIVLGRWDLRLDEA